MWTAVSHPGEPGTAETWGSQPVSWVWATHTQSARIGPETPHECWAGVRPVSGWIFSQLAARPCCWEARVFAGTTCSR